jgi:hypothetical protein
MALYTENERRAVLGALVASIPHWIAMFAASNFLDVPFWHVLGLYALAVVVLGTLNALGAALSWRLGGKAYAVRRFVATMRAAKLPPREYASDGIGNYLARLRDDARPLDPAQSAAVLDDSLGAMDEILTSRGRFLQAARMWKEAEIALEVVAPRAKAQKPHPYSLQTD